MSANGKVAIIDDCAQDLRSVFQAAGWQVVNVGRCSEDSELAEQARTSGAVMLTYDKHLWYYWKEHPFRLVWLMGVATRRRKQNKKPALAVAGVLLRHDATMARIYKRSVRFFLPNGGPPIPL